MSIIDKVVAALTPPESDEARVEARSQALSIAQPGDWLSQILRHHQQIEHLFTAVIAADDATTRTAAQKQLAELLTAHSIAEEAVIYPAMAAEHQIGHAGLAYQEQSAAKMEMGLLEKLDPMSEDYLDKIRHIQGAVTHHIYSEEGTWFLDLARSAPAQDQQVMGDRYAAEFARYKGQSATPHDSLAY